MTKRWVENTTSSPRVIGGKLLQPGEGHFVNDGPLKDPALNILATADPLSVAAAGPNGVAVMLNPDTSKLYGKNGGELTLLSGSGNGFVNGYPTVRNSDIIILADSRGANVTEGASAGLTQRIASRGWVDYMLEAAGYRGTLTGNYGQNTSTLDDMIARLTGPGINAAVGSMLTTSPGKDAGFCLFLGGVNNGGESIVTTGPKYDTIFMSIVDAGIAMGISNEMPNSDQSGGGPANYGRREYLDNWPWSSIGMTPAQKISYAKRVVIFNGYDLMADPANIYYPKANYYPAGDLLHPGALGTKVYGEGLGVVVGAVLAANGYAKRNTLPSDGAASLLPNSSLTGSVAVPAVGYGSSTAQETAGVGGQNKDGLDAACVTGNLPTGWNVTRGTSLRTLLNAAQPVANAQLSVVCSKRTSNAGRDTVRLTVTGKLGLATGTVYGLALTNTPPGLGGLTYNAGNIGATNGAQGVADGDLLYALARLSVSAAATGLLGVSVGLNALQGSFPLVIAGERAAFSGISNTYDRAFGTDPAFAKDFMSPATPIPVGWCGFAQNKVLNQSFVVSIASGVDINFWVEFERPSIVKNR